MRLLSVTLRNYRVHRELRVDFDRDRTLIGGPNESGKSTLIEAIHRVLFLKAKGNTQEHRDMQSQPLLGHPEVELGFESSGRTYHLAKRFGTNGTVSLAASDTAAISGETAETELARILGVEPSLTGRAMTGQWAHLWVWQGGSGQDPCEKSSDQHAALLKRLQDLGGAGVMQSDLDDRVARRFAEVAAQVFNQNGRPKAGSALALAEEVLARVESEAALARARWQRLEETAASLAQARCHVATAEESLRRQQAEETETETKLQVVAGLRQKETAQAGSLQNAERSLGEVREIQALTLRLRTEAENRSRELAPLRATVQEHEATLSARKLDLSAAEGRHNAALEAARAARLRSDLIAAWVARRNARSEQAELSTQQRRATQLRSDKEELTNRLARLPAVDPKSLRRLQKLQGECATARAALEAMAAGVELVASDQPVVAAGRSLLPGERRIFIEEAELAIGAAVRLRILPGGGNSLVEARQKEADAKAELQAELDRLGVPTVEAGATAALERDLIGGELKQIAAKLEGMQADRIEPRLLDVTQRLAQSDAEILRLRALVPDAPREPEADAAPGWETDGREILRRAEADERSERAARDLAFQEQQKAEEKLSQARTRISVQDQELAQVGARLVFVEQQHGTEPTVALALQEAGRQARQVRGEWETTRSELSALQPDILEQRLRRLKAAREETDKALGQQRERIAADLATLQAQGGEDPRGALNAAEARVRSARLKHEGVQRHAEAIRLLSQLFGEERQALADQLTRPLQEKVSGYLQCLFGPGAAAQLGFSDETFGDLRLTRPHWAGSSFEFERLSGGAKEQTAVAVRLAMAEVLAESHGGCLPIVLDDAFAYSDPDRVARLQDMLFLASNRGLQVIVLTCTPTDYALLGGRALTLVGRPPAPVSGVVSANDPPPSRILEPEEGPQEATPTMEIARVAVTPEQRARFLDRLGSLGGSSGNQSLRLDLGWDEATYAAVKQSVIDDGSVQPGRGRGGSVRIHQP